jgi:hypothetical protein
LPEQIQNQQRSIKLTEVIRGPLPENIIWVCFKSVVGQAVSLSGAGKLTVCPTHSTQTKHTHIICPHGYSLSDQAEAIAQVFDTENLVYLSVGTDVPDWYQPAIADVLAQFGLRLCNLTDFSVNDEFCSVCQPILSSRLAVFDISASDPIIFYKLGMAHTIRSTLHCSEEKGAPDAYGTG